MNLIYIWRVPGSNPEQYTVIMTEIVSGIAQYLHTISDSAFK
jgi:hypothetical protein